MKKLQLLPDSSSYNVKFGEGNISTRLSGGASRVRKDTVDNVHSINVGFNLNKEQYQYIMAFYRHITKRGALPFLMDLITDDGTPLTHKVQIVPNTFQLTEQSGRKYGITFTVEAEPLSEHAESDTQLIANYESGKPLHTDPQQGWGNFFKPTELDENASNVQDGIYRINGDVVVSLRDAKGRIYQTRYTKQGIDVRFFDTKWSTWLNIGGKRLFRTFTTAYKHNTGEVVKQFDGAGINGNLPNGEYDIVVTEEYADGSQQEVARTRQVINITSGTLTTIPSNYAIFLQWSVPAKSGGYTEIWVSNNTELSNAKLINVVDWPLDSYMYTGASQHESYYFWVRPIDKRGIEGAFTGPVKGEVATPFEEDFRNLQRQLQESLNQADAKAEKKLQSLEAEVKDIVRKTTNTLNNDILTRLDSFDNRFRTEAQARADAIAQSARAEAQQRTEALQREADARTRAIQAEQSARVQAIKQSSDKAAADLLAKSNQLGTRITTVETVNNNQTQQINTLTTNVGNANAAIERESKTRADADAAEARARETLVAKLNDNTAAINEEKRVRAEKDSSQVQQFNQLSSKVAGAEADITSLRKTFSDKNSSQAQQLTELSAKFSNINVGGRNLIRKSNPDTNDNQYLHQFAITEAPAFGDDVIVTLWGDLGQRSAFAVYNSRGFGELAQLTKISDGVYQAKFKWADNTYTGPDDKLTNTTLNVYAYPNTSTSNFTIKKVKFERGTVPTDWTPAPEDVEQSVANTQAQITQYGNALAQKEQALTEQLREANSRIGQNSSKITNLETTKASKNEVSSLARNTLRSEWENTAATAKRDAIAAAQTDAQNKATAARQAAEAAAQTKADAAKAAAIAAAQGDAESKANAAKAAAIADAAAKVASVKQQAADDAQRKADKAKADAIAEAKRLNDITTASITQLQKTISGTNLASAEETKQITARLDKLAIGARNLVRASNVQVQNSNYLLQTYLLTDNSLKQGEPITITIWGELASGREAFLPFNSNGWNWLGTMKKVSDGVYRLTATWDKSKNNPSNDKLLIYQSPETGTGTSRIDRIKLERGTIPSDWTPAAEDLDISVAEVAAQFNQYKKAQVTKDEAQTQEINAAKSRLQTAESSIEDIKTTKATKTEVTSIAKSGLQSLWESSADNAKSQAVAAAQTYATSKANDARIAAEQAAQAKADAAKAQAIASASSDATSKSNAAKAQAIADAAAKDAVVKQQAAADAQAKADKALQDAKAHANNIEKATNAKLTKLEQTLSDAKGSLASKTEKLEARVLNIKFGGRNLVKESNPNVTDVNYLHTFKITEAPKFGEDVVVTLWGELGQGRTDFAVYNSEGWGELAKLKKVSDGIYQAQFKWADNTYTGRDKRTNVNLNVYAYPQSATSNNTIKKVKFERGTIGTDWSPAPEDVGIEVDKTKATINEFKQTQATKDEASARKQTELTSKVNGLTTKVETNASTINGVSGEKTVFIDNNGYLTGYKLLSDRNSGQPRGEIYFSVDKFKVGKPGYNNITPFTIDTANRIIAIDGSLVVNGEALIRKLNAGVIDAAKIKAGSIDSSRVAANAITADKIGAGQVTAQKIASNAITADHIASNSISTDKLITGSVTAAKIATGSITADKMHIENLSALSSDLGNVRAGDINIGGGAFTVDRSGNLYARNGRFEGTVYADKIEGDVLKFYPFSKANTGRYRLVYTNTNQKDVLLSLQNLSFLTPNSKSSYWVKIKINGQQVYRQEFWSIFSHTSGGRYGNDIYRGIFYNVPFIYIVNGNTTSEIIIEVDNQTDYNTSAVDIISIPYILAARI